MLQGTLADVRPAALGHLHLFEGRVAIRLLLARDLADLVRILVLIARAGAVRTVPPQTRVLARAFLLNAA